MTPRIHSGLEDQGFLIDQEEVVVEAVAETVAEMVVEAVVEEVEEEEDLHQHQQR